jgi:release factor glutamine methyltransferase
MRVREAIADAARRLTAVPGPARLDAERLMAAALGVEAGAMKLSHLDDPAPAAFEPLVRRRLANEPIGYIVGRVGFWTIELDVGPGALIPRADSETLIEAAVDHFGARGPRTILDLGTGPGTLLLAALAQWPEARGLGVDRAEAALAFASGNAARLGLADRAAFRLGDWSDGLEARFDLVLCNPPYVDAGAALDAAVVDWEPAGALFAGTDGLDAYRDLASQIPPLIAPGGIACIELGAGQEAAVRALFESAAVTISSRRDLNGVSRALIVATNRG